MKKQSLNRNSICHFVFKACPFNFNKPVKAFFNISRTKRKENETLDTFPKKSLTLYAQHKMVKHTQTIVWGCLTILWGCHLKG